MNNLTVIPAQYAKFIASLIGALVLYLQRYGAAWHLVPAVMALAASLGVAGVPNASKPVVVPTMVWAEPKTPAAASPQPAQQPQRFNSVQEALHAPPQWQSPLPPRT